MNADADEKIAKINRLGPCWRAIWLALLHTPNCTIYAEEGCYIAEYKKPLKHQLEDFWQYEIEDANAKGWNWSGDTGVYVKKIKGPSNIQQAAIDWILSKGHFEFYLPQRTQDDDPDFQPEIEYDASINTNPGMTWQEFWNSSVKGGNDLPNWEGGPEQIMVLENDGNTWIWIAQKEPNVYYVTHGVSG